MKQQDAATAKTTQEPTTTHELFVKRDNGRWIVADEDGNTSAIEVRRKDEIRWNVEDEEAVVAFQFPRKDLFEEGYEEERWTWTASQSQPRELTVMEEAPLGEHTYSAFCLLPDGKDVQVRIERGKIGYAEGGSPPSMIVAE